MRIVVRDLYPVLLTKSDFYVDCRIPMLLFNGKVDKTSVNPGVQSWCPGHVRSLQGLFTYVTCSGRKRLRAGRTVSGESICICPETMRVVMLLPLFGCGLN